eukprot:m51a1_g8991 hypothetical protein (182) ;mRNA; r:84875-85788
MADKDKLSGPKFHDTHPDSRKARQHRRVEGRQQFKTELKENSRKSQVPAVTMMAWFRVALEESGGKPLKESEMVAMIDRYLRDQADNASALVGGLTSRPKARTGTAAGLARTKADMDFKQFLSEGFVAPDLTTNKGVQSLLEWKGDYNHISQGLIKMRRFKPRDPEMFEAQRAVELLTSKQ